MFAGRRQIDLAERVAERVGRLRLDERPGRRPDRDGTQDPQCANCAQRRTRDVDSVGRATHFGQPAERREAEDASPGALDTRIATLTSFVCLLAGHVRPRQRGAIEDSIALAYARAGYADGVEPSGLTPPRLLDVQGHLRAAPGLDDVAQRLERFTTGAGRWLLSGPQSSAPLESAAFVLTGLPEEERVAAMFLVLDRVWSALANSDRKTLVVVDEAWWLMRHPDTVSFLFRLAKTARKRHAGLTLITQDVSDVLARPEGEAMIANSALQILMKQAPQAMPRLAELFRLTPAEQSWLLNAQRGEALMVAQGRRVPFQVVPTDEEARLIAGKGVAA